METWGSVTKSSYWINRMNAMNDYWMKRENSHSLCEIFKANDTIQHQCIILCLFSRWTRLYNPLCPSVGWSHFTFFNDFISLTSLLLPNWSGDLKYGPCPPARDFGSRVSGLVLISYNHIKLIWIKEKGALKRKKQYRGNMQKQIFLTATRL